MEQSKPSSQQLSFKEFVALMALLMSLVALSTDAMLPALQVMGEDLSVASFQDIQLVVTILFLGMAIGQFFYGPLSDQIGRKKGIYIGLILFILGSILSWFAEDFSTMLAGRFLQGLGAAGSKIVVVAMIRDLFAGASMARVMSFIMGVFILVPVLAPAMGQAIFLLWGWRAIFFSFILLGLLGGLWLAIRQRETLLPERRILVTPSNLWDGTCQTFRTPTALGYMLASGIIFGPFVGYLSSAQQIFQSVYGVGQAFPYYFAALALSIGLASMLNGRIVMSIGMVPLVRIALTTSTVVAAAFLTASYFYDFVPPFGLFVVSFILLFFANGILFGNLNSLAMEDVGEIAGIASAIIGAISTFLAMFIAWIIGRFYDETLLPLTVAFVISGLLTLFIVKRVTALERQ
ncbi:multidrug effflux MFS transporter [Cohaesibacter gelatinilyticus]|uniref:Bcr/CflA family efflux transporter n=1 Tax=Cohaesibacter gelatinilyticus TaxID=372072 RepID=A0A285N7E1_9HYPH|nr:multidrug effflux MFS transporter [Cohaesibacter gelatinilyticus]SNZ05339.1 MFS transporter, DHA1 family, bicyclomycin/chloramphenicol resistance protein [Cohaesibacter gelatinilyticus]